MLKLAVALMPAAKKMVVRPLSGTTWSKFKPAKQYVTKQRKAAASLTSAEYVDFLISVVGQISRSTKKAMIIVHDRDPTHLSSDVVQLVVGKGLKLMVLPPRSPDLNPLDYAVFSNSKAWLERNRPGERWDWDSRCTAFVQHIQKINPAAQVAGYVKRLEAVVAASGGHIER